MESHTVEQEASGDDPHRHQRLRPDGQAGRWPHEELRRARAASMSLIPTTTGSAAAMGLIFPDLLGKLNGLAVRVPLLTASLTDRVFEADRPTTAEEVNGLLAAGLRTAEGPQ